MPDCDRTSCSRPSIMERLQPEGIALGASERRGNSGHSGTETGASLRGISKRTNEVLQVFFGCMNAFLLRERVQRDGVQCEALDDGGRDEADSVAGGVARSIPVLLEEAAD